MNDYRPRPGSAAEKALDYIGKNGGAARSGEIAAAIGIETKQISAGLAALVEHGLLVACDVTAPGKPPQKEYRISGGGKPMTWREPKSAHAAAPATGKPAHVAAHETVKPAPKLRKAPKPAKSHPRGASRPRVTGRLLRAAAKGQQKTAKPAQIIPENIPGQEPIRSATNFRCGVFSDGSLVLRLRDGSLAELPPDDTRALLDYLDRSLLREAA